MIRTKLFSWLSILVYTLTFFLASFTMWIPPAQADCVFIFFCSNNKSSFKSKGGVRRGPCAGGDDISLIALAPDKKGSFNKSLKTVQEYPTFWFYIPAYKSSENPINDAKFVLLDQENHLVQDPIYVKLDKAWDEGKNNSKSSGVIAGLTLPSTEKALEVGKKYNWHFSIICDPQKPSRNPEVVGQIERVFPARTLTKFTERAYIVHDITYSNQNNNSDSFVWYDTINNLVQLVKLELVKKPPTYRSYLLSDLNNLLSLSEISSSDKPKPIVELGVTVPKRENCTPRTKTLTSKHFRH